MRKERNALQRTRARQSGRGFTLIELMVVVILVAVMAAIAAPSFQTARNDRVAFDYARQYQQILVQGRSRAAGTGSAHLVLMTGGNGGAGTIRLYAALDGTTGAGPNPVSSCKLNPGQWTSSEPETTDYRIDHDLSDNFARFINYADVNRVGINQTMGLKAELSAGAGSATTLTSTTAVAVCVTPSGVTYVGWGDDAAAAVAMMRTATPFTGVVQTAIQRHVGTTGVGLKRLVVVAGGGTPRLRSE